MNNKEKEQYVVHNHESSGWWIAGLAFSISIALVGEKAVEAWKDVQLSKQGMSEQSK